MCSSLIHCHPRTCHFLLGHASAPRPGGLECLKHLPHPVHDDSRRGPSRQARGCSWVAISGLHGCRRARGGWVCSRARGSWVGHIGAAGLDNGYPQALCAHPLCSHIFPTLEAASISRRSKVQPPGLNLNETPCKLQSNMSAANYNFG